MFNAGAPSSSPFVPAASLPHRKYYNLEAYDKYRAAKRASKGLKAVEKKVRGRRGRRGGGARLRVYGLWSPDGLRLYARTPWHITICTICTPR